MLNVQTIFYKLNKEEKAWDFGVIINGVIYDKEGVAVNEVAEYRKIELINLKGVNRSC